MLWAVLGQPSLLARVQPQPFGWLGCSAHAKPQHHGDSGTCSWSCSSMIFSKLSHGGLTLPSSKQHQAHHRCCRKFQRSFCGSWHRTEGHEGAHEHLEALNPLVHKHLLCTEGRSDTPQERQMPGEMTTDNSKREILVVLSLGTLQPAKPAWLQRGG